MNGRQVALIRGINVGRAKRVAMADLRALVEGLGYTNVRTLLNSGNVVFDDSGAAPGDDAASRIERALAARLGVPARVMVLTADELAAVVAGNPLSDIADDPSRLLVAFFIAPEAGRLLDSLAEQDWSPEVLAVGERAAYIWCPEGILASRLQEAVGRALGDSVTTRNWNTVTKLHALAGSHQPRAAE